MKNRIILSVVGMLVFAGFPRYVSGQSLTPGLAAGGSIRVSTVFYHVNGIENRRAPFGIIASGSPYLELFGNRIPFQFTISNFRSQFHQPFNQIGISPNYKWARLHLGYRNLQFSQFTLGGARLMGAGVELTPGKFYFGGVYGRFRAARTFGNADLAIIPGMYTVGAVYERTGYSFKVGVGQTTNFFHLIFLKASDNINSIALTGDRVMPPVQHNSVLGLTGGLQLFRHLQWKAEVALSAWTLDNRSPLTSGVPEFVNRIYTPRSSSQYLTAAETSLGFRKNGYAVEAKYRRIDPDYKSMGMYYVQSDLEQITGNVTLPLGNGRWFINASAGIQKDNLARIKSVTSSRVIINSSATLRFTEWLTLAAMFSNFGLSQSPVQATISDTLLLEQVHRNLMIGPNMQFRQGSLVHNIRLQYMEQSLSDLKASAFGMPELTSRIYMTQYSLGIPSRKMNAGIGLQQMSSFLGPNKLTNTGVNGSFSKRLSHKNMQVNAQSGFSLNQLDGAANGYTLRMMMGLNYPLLNNMNLSLQTQWLNNKAVQEGPVKSFTEWTLRTTVSYQFKTQTKKQQ